MSGIDEKTYTVIRTEGDRVIFQKVSGGEWGCRLGEGVDRPPPGRIVATINHDLSPWQILSWKMFQGGGNGAGNYRPHQEPAQQHINTPQPAHTQSMLDDPKQVLITATAIYKSMIAGGSGNYGSPGDAVNKARLLIMEVENMRNAQQDQLIPDDGYGHG